jgi:hypothetical protein
MSVPGVRTLIRDRFYTASRQDVVSGPRIVAIARRDTADGTAGINDLDLVRASNEKDVIDAFGEGSDLHRAFYELLTAGADRVYLVALPGDTVFNHSQGTVTSANYGGDIFDDAFEAAAAALPDVIVPWGRGGHPLDWEDPATPSNDPEYGFHADNSPVPLNSWAFKVARKAKEISEELHPCVAVLGVKPYLSVSENMTASEVRAHLALNDLVSVDSGPAFEDYGPYVTVVATEVRLVNPRSLAEVRNFGYTNGATSVAAAMSRLPSYSSLYNKPLFNVQALRYSPSRSLQGELVAKGVNTVAINFNKLAVFAESVTFAKKTSDYVRLSTKRIVDEATSLVRQVCSRFIGEPSNIQNRNGMETAITGALRGMQTLGALLDSDFVVSYIPSQNKAIIDLVLTPAFELRNIEVRIAISL